MICKNCGTQLPEETKVCPNCGSTLEVEQAPTEVTSNTNDTELSAGEMKKKKYFIWGIYFFALMGLLRFFNNGGFSASFLWWIALAALLFIAFLAFGATDGKAKSDLSASKVMLGASVALYFLIYVFVSPNSSEGSGSPSEVANNEHPSWAQGEWGGSTSIGYVTYKTDGENYEMEYPGYKDSGTWRYDEGQNVIFMTSSNSSSMYGGVLRVVSHSSLDVGSQGQDIINKR